MHDSKVSWLDTENVWPTVLPSTFLAHIINRSPYWMSLSTNIKCEHNVFTLIKDVCNYVWSIGWEGKARLSRLTLTLQVQSTILHQLGQTRLQQICLPWSDIITSTCRVFFHSSVHATTSSTSYVSAPRQKKILQTLLIRYGFITYMSSVHAALSGFAMRYPVSSWVGKSTAWIPG